MRSLDVRRILRRASVRRFHLHSAMEIGLLRGVASDGDGNRIVVKRRGELRAMPIGDEHAGKSQGSLVPLRLSLIIVDSPLKIRLQPAALALLKKRRTGRFQFGVGRLW